MYGMNQTSTAAMTSTAVPCGPWHLWGPALSRMACVWFVSAKLRYRIAMDHAEHVLIDGTNMPLRITGEYVVTLR